MAVDKKRLESIRELNEIQKEMVYDREKQNKKDAEFLSLLRNRMNQASSVTPVKARREISAIVGSEKSYRQSADEDEFNGGFEQKTTYVLANRSKNPQAYYMDKLKNSELGRKISKTNKIRNIDTKYIGVNVNGSLEKIKGNGKSGKQRKQLKSYEIQKPKDDNILEDKHKQSQSHNNNGKYDDLDKLCSEFLQTGSTTKSSFNQK
jgi:hypothetical protein